jgi:hypothetical protein
VFNCVRDVSDNIVLLLFKDSLLELDKAKVYCIREIFGWR